MANEDAINAFLDEYTAPTPGQPPTPATPAPEQPVTPQKPQIEDYLNQVQAQPPEQPPTSPGRSPEQAALMTHETVTKKEPPRLAAFTESVKKGFADFAAIPGYAVDLVNWPLHKLGITPEHAVGDSDMIRKGWELLTGYQEIKPRTKGEKYLQTMGEFAGSSILPSGGLVSKVASKGIMPEFAKMAGKEITPALNKQVAKQSAKMREVWNISGKKGMLPRMTEPATNTELAAVIGAEAASVVTGSVGSEFGGEVGHKVAGAPGEVLGRIVGGISAGMTPLYFKTAGSTIWNSVQAAKTISKDRASMMDNIAKAKIIQAIGENPQAPQNIEAASRLQKEIPGFNPNMAAAAGSPGLESLQTRLDMQSIDNMNRATENIRKSQEAIDHYYTSAFQVSGKNLSATKTYRHTLKNLKSESAATEQELENIAQQYQRVPTGEVGARLREMRAQRKNVIRNQVNAAYDDLYKAADDLGIVDDASDLYALSREFNKQDPHIFQTMPSVYAKMRSIFGNKVEKASQDATGMIVDTQGNLFMPPLKEDSKIMTNFQEMHSLYREVSKQYGKSLKAGDAQKSFYLGQIKELLDNKLLKFDDPVYGNFANHKKAVDDFFLNEYHKVFRQGVGGKIPYETRWGEVTPDEKIVSSLVMQKGTARGINQFNKLYEDMPQAQILLRDGIMDMFTTKAIKDGKIDSNAVRGFLNDYKEVFDNIPDLRNVFMNSDSLTTALANRQAAVIKKGKLLSQKSISPYAKIAGFESPKAAVQAGLDDPKIMRILSRNAKTKAERHDLTSLIADVVLEKPDPWRYILENEGQLKDHFNTLKSGHFQKLKNIAEAQSVLSRYKPPRYVETEEKDLFYKKFGTSFASALAQWRWALLYNKTSIYYPAADMASKYLYKIRADKIDDLMERALYDPDLATTLSELTRVTPTTLGNLNVMENIKKLGLHAINNGMRASTAAIPDEKQDMVSGRSEKLTNLMEKAIPFY